MGPWLVCLALAPLLTGLERVGERHGVVIYRDPRLAGVALAAEGELPAPPERVRALLLDYEHAQWVKGVGESRVLERHEDRLHVYQKLTLPVIADRDFTLKVTWGAEDGTLWLRFSADNARGPAPIAGVVRVHVHDGEWQLVPIDGGRRTRAHYRFHLVLGGSVPGWLGRGQAVRDIAGLFQAIRARVQ
jgi:hypothetical protein